MFAKTRKEAGFGPDLVYEQSQVPETRLSFHGAKCLLLMVLSVNEPSIPQHGIGKAVPGDDQPPA
jgi:hypothetical protein